MAHAMTAGQIRDFLGEGRRTGKVATTRSDGRPHVVPVWFVLDGDDLVFMTGASTVKGKALARDPRLTLAVDLEEPPYSFVMVEGTATLSDDLDAMLPLSIAIARRYVPAEQAERFGRRNAVEGELLVRMTPTRIVAFADLTG
jgi:PPOX class probable F420-dependent enzyme